MTGITDQGLKMISESNFRTKLKVLWVQALRSATDKGKSKKFQKILKKF